jgi:hypothetical protein
MREGWGGTRRNVYSAVAVNQGRSVGYIDDTVASCNRRIKITSTTTVRSVVSACEIQVIGRYPKLLDCS